MQRASSCRTGKLAKAKALRALMDGHQQPLLQVFLGVILQQVQLVEAGVRAGQAI